MILEQLAPLFFIGVGIAFAFVNMYYITKMMRRAFSPKWSEAEMMVRLLKEMGVKARVHSVDAAGIIRLLILSEPMPVTLEDIRKVFQRDIRRETETRNTAMNKPKLVLAVLPSSGKPHKAKAATQRPNATPALQPMPTR